MSTISNPPTADHVADQVNNDTGTRSHDINSITVADLQQLTVHDYHRMGEIGIVSADDPVELLAGYLVRKMPKGTLHTSATKRVEKLLEHLLGDRVLVRVQDPINVGNRSEPEPDLAIVHPHPAYYDDHHPIAEEIYLIVEIADTTLGRDLGLKANIYAQAGIADYWVLNLNERQLHVFRNPQLTGYQSELVLSIQAQIAPLAFPDCPIAVQDLLA